ncbi:hypothetical protein HELRODRAFT_93282 [Helobdella robusta]|uniref:Inorganic pyrophosphatase n=1 Tax=Helobdella robusta TaxID=6412 RepID=T1G8U9_HELRO|nr:hypothetical protein HELRODRAFT_93282 [Helobdella robusta]ESO12438.1 hypothetical protein HELRODRAFT_93282 [Helobdella robusta]
MSYSIVEKGALNSLQYQVYFVGPDGGYVSPFHDIPLYASKEKKIFNMVVEVPRWTNAKMEISKEEKLNPIKQDIKKGKLRYINNCFPHHGYIWNYGAFPQTWENPKHIDAHTLQKGDNDPLDVCEIGYKVKKRGDVVQVKVLGVMALIDEGETDWKILAIDVKDPLADKLNGVKDIEEHMPGFLAATHEWFKIYKMPTGKPANQFAFEGKPKDREFALEIICQAHEQWNQLIHGKADPAGISCMCTSLKESKFVISKEDAAAVVHAAPPAAPAEDVPEMGLCKVMKMDYQPI